MSGDSDSSVNVCGVGEGVFHVFRSLLFGVKV